MVCWDKSDIKLSFCHSSVICDGCLVFFLKRHQGRFVQYALYSNTRTVLASVVDFCFQRVFFNVLPQDLLLFICSCFLFHCHSCLCLGCVTGTPEAGAASRAIWVFPDFDATRVCLEHVHSGPDCPGDLFSHRKPLPEGQLLSQHGWIQTLLELPPWAGQVSVQVPPLRLF